MLSRAMKFTRNVVLGAFASVLMLAGCGKNEAPPPPGEPVVSVVTIEAQSTALTTELTGRTVAYRMAEIRPQVNGIIQKRLFEEGSEVKAGQALYKIDPAPYQAALDNARAALARAEANLTTIQLRKDRFEKLLPDNAVSQQDYDDVTAGLKQAQAEVESWKAQVKLADINLVYTDVIAPISGRIGRSNITEGAIVTAYQPLNLTTIQQLDPIYVDLPQSTTEMLRLKRHLLDGSVKQDGADQGNIRLIQEDGMVYPLAGTLQFRDISVDPSTGSVVLRALFPNPDGALLPDMFVRGIVTEGINQQAILVPQQGVARDSKGDPFAWIVDAEGHAQIRRLVIDRAMGDKWLVSEGLAPGDQLVVEGLMSLRRPGAAVKAVPFKEGGSPGGLDEHSHQPATQSN
ncbi:MAG: efflux RND transporter periplasmic adaptor subunit [Candidatus Eisenbacteria bacterium]|uniref:Efflux RND transporter periplasmic adaptor subunit n=1 Tax=Eiseniibacteriota bacterium TaxID=2212470 RepID=A0A948RUF9_UNCEI|nr:efflux RND transporter periplasmic adaptor subunit [Candidatus Eisenbacteria bacterium]MBU1951042.1 efflux RND transporter periplasmic adaptor subunit [Candidatus Eisenbacteria bacterium]MBU2689773.1 efflux RND transporter periplasmic adaptor subunit [Candidatus Eisenbacteria bacterium]